MKMEGDRPVTADIDQIRHPHCPSPGAKLLQETQHDVKTAGDHMGFSHGIHQVLRFQVLEQWREIPCRLIIMGTWLLMSLCVLTWSIHIYPLLESHPPLFAHQGQEEGPAVMIWYEVHSIYTAIWYDFPWLYISFTSPRLAKVAWIWASSRFSLSGAIFVLKLGCRPKPWGFGLTIKRRSRWHGICATVFWLIWLVILHKRTFSFECRDRYSINRRNSSVRHHSSSKFGAGEFMPVQSLTQIKGIEALRSAFVANSPGSPRSSSHGGWIGHRRILRIRFCFPPTALAPQPHGGTSETKVDSWHPLTTQDSWIMGIFWVSLNGFAEFQMQCGQLQDLKGHSVVA